MSERRVASRMHLKQITRMLDQHLHEGEDGFWFYDEGWSDSVVAEKLDTPGRTTWVTKFRAEAYGNLRDYRKKKPEPVAPLDQSASLDGGVTSADIDRIEFLLKRIAMVVDNLDNSMGRFSLAATMLTDCMERTEKKVDAIGDHMKKAWGDAG